MSMEREQLESLFANVSRSVVSITVRGSNAERVPRGSGFVVHVDDQFTVVSIMSRFVKSDENFSVLFFDGTETADTTLIKVSGVISLIVAAVPRGDWKHADFGDDTEDGAVLAIATKYKKFLPFVTRIVCPDCRSIDSDGNESPRSFRDMFGIRLHFGGQIGVTKERKEVLLANSQEIVGTCLFDMKEKLIGIVFRPSKSIDIKVAIRSRLMSSNLDKWRKGKNWKDAISEHIKNRCLKEESICKALSHISKLSEGPAGDGLEGIMSVQLFLVRCYGEECSSLT